MKIDIFLTSLRKDHQVTVYLQEGELKIKASKELITVEIINSIKERKQEIIAFLSQVSSLPNEIPQLQVKPYYALSFAQKRLYFLYELDRASLAYNMPRAIRLTGEVNAEKIKAVFCRLIRRHASLRSSFHVIGQEVVQQIHEEIGFTVDVQEVKTIEVDKAIHNFIRPFKLSTAGLIRVTLLQSKAFSLLMVDTHHIISDAWSMNILVKEFLKLYAGQELQELKLQYTDYADWQQNSLLDTQKAFWQSQFSHEAPRLDLPVDFDQNYAIGLSGNSKTFVLSDIESQSLRLIARRYGVTLFSTLLSMFNIFLHKVCNQDDIVVGTPVTGRLHVELEPVVGLFVNTVIIRSFPKSELTFKEFLEQVSAISISCLENQAFPYEQLIHTLGLKREDAKNPLFDVFFAYQKASESAFTIPSVVVMAEKIEQKSVKFDLAFTAVDQGNAISFIIDYAEGLFMASTIDRFITYFKHIVKAVCTDNHIFIKDIDILSDDEKSLLLKQFNDTNVVYPSEKTVVSIFEDRVDSCGECIAIRSEICSWTYAELNKQSNRIAFYLRSVAGVRSGDLVGVLLERENYLIATIIGILKTGAAYVPMDTGTPPERLFAMAEDAGLKRVVSRARFITNISAMKPIIVNLDELESEFIAQLNPVDVLPEDIAYVIYTSGSTGVPKGVVITHLSLMNRLFWMQNAFPLNSNSILLQKAPVVFDVSVWELFAWILAGGSLYLLPPGLDKEPAHIVKAIQAQNIDAIHFVPSMLGAFLVYLKYYDSFPNLSCLKQVHASGEALSRGHVTLFDELLHSSYGTKLLNMYGPTETCIEVSCYECDFKNARELIPIGKPIQNTRFYVLGRNGELLPYGTAGELHIAGVGLAKGYLNNTKLTSERFFKTRSLIDERVYKTGDLVRWLPDGNMVFLGRIDQQVKIRGYRIEPGEIEYHLKQHEQLTDVVVVVVGRGNAEDIILVAYYVSESLVEESLLQKFLSEKLPAYMVPARFVQIDKIPTTSNGKLDTKALPDPPKSVLNVVRKIPETCTEKMLVSIFADLLSLPMDEIGMSDDFFMMGGHSVMALRLIYRIQDELSAEIALRDVFNYSTIEKLATIVDSNITEIPVLGQVSIVGMQRTSSAQERLYFENMMAPESLLYNVNCIYSIKGNVNIETLQRSLQDLVNRHEALRTTFHLFDEQVVQRIHEQVDLQFCCSTINDQDISIAETYQKFVQPFELSKAPLMRCLFRNDVLYIDIHHIICDGVSLNVLMNDFKHLLAGVSLPPIKYRYADYINWTSKTVGRWREQRNYWKQKLSGVIPVLEMPRTKSHDNLGLFKVQSKTLIVRQDVSKMIKKIIASEQVSEYMVLLSIFYILLYKITGNRDLIVGSDVVGRSKREFKNVVGTFVNELPLRVDVDPVCSYKDFLKQVRESVIQGLHYQDFQLNDMLSLLQRKENAPLFYVHFSYANFLDSEIDLADYQFSRIEPERQNRMSQYELKLEVYRHLNEQRIAFVYACELYEDSTIELLMQYFHNISSFALQNLEINIGQIPADYISDPATSQINKK